MSNPLTRMQVIQAMYFKHFRVFPILKVISDILFMTEIPLSQLVPSFFPYFLDLSTFVGCWTGALEQRCFSTISHFHARREKWIGLYVFDVALAPLWHHRAWTSSQPTTNKGVGGRGSFSLMLNSSLVGRRNRSRSRKDFSWSHPPSATTIAKYADDF